MPERIVVVTSAQDIYFFDEEEKLYEFLNEEGEFEPEDEDDKNDWEVLDSFPIPVTTTSGYGYCPFTAWDTAGGHSIWPVNGVIVLWNDKLVHLKKHIVTKEVKTFAYGSSPQRNGAKTRWAKKTAAKAQPTKKRRGRRPRAGSTE